jgi:hypothetical protein
MASRGQTPPATKVRVPLQPLKTQKMKEQMPAVKKRKRIEEEDKEAKLRPGTETARPVPDLREQAGNGEKNILAFCLEPSRRLIKNRPQQSCGILRIMTGIVEELLLHNSYLTGKLEQSTGPERKGGADPNCRKPDAANQQADRDCPPTPSYAEKIKMTSNKIGQIAIKPPKNVVIIRPEALGSNIKSSEQAREAVFTLVNPRRKGIQVTAVKKISDKENKSWKRRSRKA